MSRTILVEGKKVFRVTIPDDARLTFGPWSPPTGEAKAYGINEKALSGTLRVYSKGTKATENILAVFSGVTGFRDLSTIDVAERVATEEVRTVWKSDAKGYSQEVVGSKGAQWIDPAAELEAGEDGEEESF